MYFLAHHNELRLAGEIRRERKGKEGKKEGRDSGIFWLWMEFDPSLSPPGGSVHEIYAIEVSNEQYYPLALFLPPEK